jgi:hypothetical protein
LFVIEVVKGNGLNEKVTLKLWQLLVILAGVVAWTVLIMTLIWRGW